MTCGSTHNLMHVQDGGVLYTWGGVGGAFASEAAEQLPPRKEDSNKGCLGLGDTSGRKLPTRYVSSESSGVPVNQASKS